ncbi:MAG TPA: LysM domain-containing protein, partial [Candidatus Ozemobacteraceae bacterium]|nr:LysM domain-containing protein [Candidatus Ozemobacteraceae bacterium]
LLVGRIDSLINEPVIRQPVRPAPEGAFAPAARTIPPEPVAAAPKTAPATQELAKATAAKGPQVQDKGRYLEYTIERGDTLDSISTKLYGNTRMTGAIVRLNRIRDEKALRLGERLLLPRTGLVVRLAAR